MTNLLEKCECGRDRYPYDKVCVTCKMMGEIFTRDDDTKWYVDVRADELMSVRDPKITISMGALETSEFKRLNFDICGRCHTFSRGVDSHYSYGIYAGKMCDQCAYDSYRDHCGLVKNADGSFGVGGQGDQNELRLMGETIEPEDY